MSSDTNSKELERLVKDTEAGVVNIFFLNRKMKKRKRKIDQRRLCKIVCVCN